MEQNIRYIDAFDITKKIKELFLDCNYFIGDDISNALQTCMENEELDIAKNVLSQLIENNKIARDEQIPICQDTGMAIIFVKYGDKVCIKNGNFKEAIEEGVRLAYIDGYLRKSVVSDPAFDRINTKDNTPCIIHTEIVSGDTLSFTVGGKGFGSENMSGVKMLSPSDGIDSVINFVMETVKKAGPNPCPPIVVGVGVGGTFEKACILAKKATFRDITTENSDKRYADVEKLLLSEINKLNIGPAGLGGKTTALGVNIETYPTHIAGLPVAVNICCHAARHKSGEI